MKKVLLFASLLVLTLTGCGPKWTSLFNGKDLSGWHQAVGEAEYAVEKGCITGTTHVSGGPNSFLVTDATYGDFILEFEFLVDDALNSGVQLRSHSNKD
jgi:cation diffusion facilitator CzcD-associated flavoprotein CzcO